MNGLFKDTLAELFEKKTVYMFFVITIIAMVLTVSSSNLSLSINGSEQAIGIDELGFNADTSLLNAVQALMSFLTFLAVMLSAGILPNMFIKGRADYFLSKPLSRNSLLLKKLCSIWIVYGLLISICGLVCYLTGALVYSLFNKMIFMLIGFALIEFFIWLSISIAVGIITGKAVTTIMILFVTWFVQKALSLLHDSQAIIEQFGYKTLGKAIDYLYYIFPKMSELSTLADNMVSHSASLNSYILYSSVGFALCMVYFTMYLFGRKNY